MKTRPGGDLGVAVVSYNTREILARCLDSLIADGAEDVVVVDNGSSDGSAALVHQRFPNVRVEAQANRGYGAAANYGVRCSRCAAVLVLNSDTVITRGSLQAITTYLSAHPKAGLVGPRLVNLDGSLQRSCFPFPGTVDALVSETGIQNVLRLIPRVSECLLRTWSHDRARRVPWVLGAALTVRTSAFEAVGGFDESIFMYGEEVDLARRLLDAGYETHFTPSATIVHIRGASSGDQLKTYPLRVRATLRYLSRYSSPASFYGFLVVMLVALVARAMRDGTLLALTSGTEAEVAARRLTTWKSVARDLWLAVQ